MMGRHCTMGVLLFAVCAHTPSAALRAQERSQPEGNITIVQTEWGFDGKAMSRSFVPLSVLVQNDGPIPASGTLRLTKSLGLRHQVDAAFEQSFYVSGFSSKWVQLTPFVVGEFESWEITWGPGNRNRYDIPTPRVGTGATVLFADADDISAVGSALRRCDPALFPVSVTGTDSLRGAVLHSVPEWQGARVQAFREWLERGGRVFLVHGANGEYPRFSGELAFLNDARDSVRVRTGRVTRLPLSVRDLDADLVKSLLAVDRTETNEADVARRMLEYSRGAALPIRTDFDDYILKDLRRLTRFQRNWWLVYACAGLYVLAVFPGSYLLGRRVADWRAPRRDRPRPAADRSATPGSGSRRRASSRRARTCRRAATAPSGSSRSARRTARARARALPTARARARRCRGRSARSSPARGRGRSSGRRRPRSRRRAGSRRARGSRRTPARPSASRESPS